ncbi:MAG: hypothetical protein IJ334_11635 [Clostridia bacterium]|nr:hypothetical protein [Clostridia bacterium]
MNIIDKRNLFGNENNAFILCEYQREVKLIKKLINISERAIENQTINDTWSYEGVCASFAKTIVDYSKMAYDNVLLGHFHAVNMINRSVVENLVCLDLIVSNEDLWKYYWAYSYRNTICKFNGTDEKEQSEKLQEFYNDNGIAEDFYKKQPNRQKAYIKEPYGWTYKINHNKKFTFENVCKLIDSDAEYQGFRIMSEYSHGTSFYMKMFSSISVDSMMTIFVNMYMNLYRMITVYCPDSVGEDFDNITDELECIFHRYIEYEEEHFS